MRKVDGLTDLSSSWLGVRKIGGFFPEEPNHLNNQIGRKSIESGSLFVSVIQVINITDFFKLSLQTQANAFSKSANFQLLFNASNGAA